ncbi:MULTISPECIES: serine hydrolase [unclassified Flavobacterium]|jgi:CubicO group peptidase (beta-lactamase class C family)|uniref:serine hydrolase domain-containing protein n=1 Tax=unclassified Flavobacterium TaxID=196869 RepID=UPI00131D5293|nr:MULTISPECIES: serine hydrolase domain-containing protein [unclassified Flavobacterium]
MKKIFLMLLVLIANDLLAQKTQKIDSLFQKLSSNKEFNGNVLIAEKGKVIYKNSFGLANETNKEKLNENSIFELASVSKQFTAFAIVILKEKGKLKYEDKIGDILPQLSFYKNITVRNLLNHTSGLPDYMKILDSLLIDKTWDNKTKIATNKDILDVFEKHKPSLLFEPNENWEYSNTGYAILASIIEKISGKSFAEFLKTEIFKPLKMNKTFVYTRRLKPQNIKNYAFGYVYSDSLKTNQLPDQIKGLDLYVYTLDGIVGDGTVNSTINDLLKWDRNLYTNQLVSKNGIAEIFTDATLNNGTKTEYGFGWMIDNNETFGKIANHSGSWPGYISFIERHVNNDKTIILLQNNDTKNTKIPSKQIRDILYDIKPLIFSEQYLKMISGDYKTEKGTIKKILHENGKLYIPMSEEEKFELEPINKTLFRIIGFSPEVRYEFIFENEKVTKYIVTQPEQGVKNEAMKIE